MDTQSIIKPPLSKNLKSGRVILQPGEQIGEHVTDKREELIVILKGTATLIKSNEQVTLSQGQAHYIQENIKHNIINNSKETLEYIYTVSLFSTAL